ncbi:MAG: DUF294 nucleotidyltransferase-like domain-containing protein [Rubrivivax sp.]|nr:DUF294 nucleotidyltransferase-like domain-containing protein [Rubrivivax sp.]
MLCCPGATPLQQALQQMHERRVGSVVVVDGDAGLRGILTRHDILFRVTLQQLDLQTPLALVMSTPVHCLDSDDRLQDAALPMARYGVRHVPVLRAGRVVNIVSERDLFALQRLSIRELSEGLRAAPDALALQPLAARIRQFAGQLLVQGVQARQLTEITSRLNDLLCTRLVELTAARRGLDLARVCWLSFGSEGRGEQTVATDQDNGIAFDSSTPNQYRCAWLALGVEVNAELDACGYPLCRGGVRAGNAACCLSLAEWQARFAHWVEQGAPEDLLKASIHFDLRALCGNAALLRPLRDWLATRPVAMPRFIKQMADNALQRTPPLTWRGALATREEGGHAWLDLKLQGTALFVDAARLYALAHGRSAVGTRGRFEAAAPCLGVRPQEGQAWITAFKFLRMLRLQAQLGLHGAGASAPNTIDVQALNDIDRRMLKEAMRTARNLQQRIALDYRR